MTELEWSAYGSPRQLFVTLLTELSKKSERKWLLFSCALCRSHWDRIAEDRWRQAIEFMEGYSDNPRDEDLRAWREDMAAANKDVPELPRDPAHWTASDLTLHSIGDLLWQAPSVSAEVLMVRLACLAMSEGRRNQEDHHQCNLLRDTFDNPFRPGEKWGHSGEKWGRERNGDIHEWHEVKPHPFCVSRPYARRGVAVSSECILSSAA